ncbi:MULTISPECIES: YdaS family helix-turn-helix protein [Vogesella]|uniref:YdaS family helix-turn-helix protein n=1 Tax=Vogesella TaxID=57739 RepID=UPI0009E1B6C6|nr:MULTISPECIES: YdaS family helix-turn-helix protein [Vogesella]
MDTRSVITAWVKSVGGQSAAARLIGISQPALCKILRGKCRVSPALAVLIELHSGISCEVLSPDFPWQSAAVLVCGHAGGVEALPDLVRVRAARFPEQLSLSSFQANAPDGLGLPG